MNVLSLFDGIGCGLQALKDAGVEVDNYYASEIDKYTMQIAHKNHPEIIDVGDICTLEGLSNIDLMIGGSPCQSLSNAVSYNTGFKGKSKLFWHYVRLLREIKPKYFLLENVPMKKEWERIISRELGVSPVVLDSNRFSAQERRRLYWTNFDISAVDINCEDVLGDILQSKVDSKYFYSEPHWDNGDKVICATLGINGHDIIKRVNSPNYKCHTLTAVCGGNQHKKVLVDNRVRKLTPLEYERLQTLPEGYTEGVSDSQRYRMIGNGWTVAVLTHIFKSMKMLP
jgi:site-specific DNA-cytosine methylase